MLELVLESKTTVFLLAATLSTSAMSQNFSQTKRLAYQGNNMSHSNPYFTYHDMQKEHNDLKSAKLYQKPDYNGGARAHTVLAINITIAKICLKVISKQVSCIEN